MWRVSWHQLWHNHLNISLPDRLIINTSPAAGRRNRKPLGRTDTFQLYASTVRCRSRSAAQTWVSIWTKHGTHTHQTITKMKVLFKLYIERSYSSEVTLEASFLFSVFVNDLAYRDEPASVYSSESVVQLLTLKNKKEIKISSGRNITALWVNVSLPVG